MAEFNETDSNRRVTFKLPDGDQVSLVPWEYVIDRLTANLSPTLDQMDLVNEALTVIDDKLTEWLGEEDI